MKYIKLYESFEDIDSICEKYGIEKYTINSDGIVDVDDDVYLSEKRLTKLPLKFGKVSGSFTCDTNQLITLEGSPQSVGDYFNCSRNYLTTLEGCTKSVGSFHCGSNKLTTLEFCPRSVSGYFDCNHNQLTTLEGGPQSVGDYFDCGYNKLISLEFCPQSVGGYFACSYNKLKDLYGFPEFFDNNINYSGNPVSEILDLFKHKRLGKVIDLLNEYGVVQQDGKLVILDRLEEVFYTLNIEIPKEINLENYEVY